MRRSLHRLQRHSRVASSSLYFSKSSCIRLATLRWILDVEALRRCHRRHDQLETVLLVQELRLRLSKAPLNPLCGNRYSRSNCLVDQVALPDAGSNVPAFATLEDSPRHVSQIVPQLLPVACSCLELVLLLAEATGIFSNDYCSAPDLCGEMNLEGMA